MIIKIYLTTQFVSAVAKNSVNSALNLVSGKV